LATGAFVFPFAIFTYAFSFNTGLLHIENKRGGSKKNIKCRTSVWEQEEKKNIKPVPL
jgi:hypothetical protein